MANLEKLLAQMKPLLDPGEVVEAAIAGLYRARREGRAEGLLKPGVIAATDRRVAIFAKDVLSHNFEVFPYARISSIQTGQTLHGHHVALTVDGAEVEIKNIKKGNLRELVEAVRAHLVSAKAPSASGSAATESDDVPAQIKKLAELRDQGILTAEEFEAKKQDLLAMM